MNRPTHPQLVKALNKPGEDILHSLTPMDCELIHMVMGVMTEAGELGDAVKKATMYRKELDLVNVVEELGDLEYFMERIRQILGITREQTLDSNIDKLIKRYGEKYSNEAAVKRADKVGVEG